MAQAQAQKVTLVTKEQSLSLMRNLLRISLAEVCFIRNVFPSDAFEKVSFGSTEVRVIKKDGDTEAEHKKLVDMEEAAFEALSKGYLKSIVFGIYSKNADSELLTLLESYVFNVKYPADADVEVTLSNDKGAFALPRVRDEAITLIRTLIRLAETLPRPVPEDRLINLTLFYYDDITPPDYQPPGFTDATADSAGHPSFSAPPTKHTVGKVSSKHHSMTLRVAYGPEGDDLMGELGARAHSQGVAQGQAGAGASSSSVAASEAYQAGPEPSQAEAVPEEAPVAVPVSSALPEDSPAVVGVDYQAYLAARTAVAGEGKVSLKFVLDSLAGAGRDVTNEQAKLIVRALEAEGLVVKKGPAQAFRFDVVPEAAEAVMQEAQAAAAAQQEAQSKAVDVSMSSSAAPAPEATVDDNEEQAPSMEPGPSLPKLMARQWYTRAVVAVLAKRATRPFVTVGDLAIDAAGMGADEPVEAFVANRLAKKLQKDGILLAPGADGHPANKGRAVAFNDRTPQLLRDGVKALQDLGEPVPAYATQALLAQEKEQEQAEEKQQSQAVKRTAAPAAVPVPIKATKARGAGSKRCPTTGLDDLAAAVKEDTGVNSSVAPARGAGSKKTRFQEPARATGASAGAASPGVQAGSQANIQAVADVLAGMGYKAADAAEDGEDAGWDAVLNDAPAPAPAMGAKGRASAGAKAPVAAPVVAVGSGHKGKQATTGGAPGGSDIKSNPTAVAGKPSLAGPTAKKLQLGSGAASSAGAKALGGSAALGKGKTLTLGKGANAGVWARARAGIANESATVEYGAVGDMQFL